MVQPAGRIYDLGYQRYDGPREGRRRAVLALYVGGLRRSWGIGRPFRAKLAPWALLLIALIPALIALGIAVLVPLEFRPIRYENYFTLVSVLLLLFCAVVAPELACPDQCQRVLSLYFARSITRADYVLARLAALTTALLIIALVPQFVLYFGNALAAESIPSYVRENWRALPRILAAATLISLYFSSIALAVAASTTRRVWAAGGFLALMFISTAVVASVHNALNNDGSRWAGLLALNEAPFAAVSWIFATDEVQGGVPNAVDLPREVWPLAVVAYTVIALALLWRRYSRLSA